MSGGRFDYLQSRYEWEDALEVIESHIKDNPDEYTEETLKRFKIGFELIKKAQIYLKRIDYLLSGDDGEETFHERIKEDHEKENLKLD
jgi:hypothetical protein